MYVSSDRKPALVSLGSAFVGMNERVSGALQYTQRVATLSVSDRRVKSLSDHLHHRDLGEQCEVIFRSDK